MKRLVAVLAACATVFAFSTALAAGTTLAGKKPTKALPAKASSAHAAPKEPAVVDSLELLQRAVAKDSTNFDNLYRLGVLYIDRDQVNNATVVLLKARQLRPNDVRTMVNLGVAYDAGGAAEAAQKMYDEALKVAPEDSVAMCRKASSLYGQGADHYNDAIDLLRKIIAEKPTAYCAYFTLGVAFADAQLYRDAIRMWQKVVDLAPASPEAVSAKESIEVLNKFLQQPAER